MRDMEYHQRMKLAYERRKKIVQLRAAGKTYKAIAQAFGGISRERVRQILKKEQRIKNK